MSHKRFFFKLCGKNISKTHINEQPFISFEIMSLSVKKPLFVGFDNFGNDWVSSRDPFSTNSINSNIYYIEKYSKIFVL